MSFVLCVRQCVWGGGGGVGGYLAILMAGIPEVMLVMMFLG